MADDESSQILKPLRTTPPFSSTTAINNFDIASYEDCFEKVDFVFKDFNGVNIESIRKKMLYAMMDVTNSAAMDKGKMKSDYFYHTEALQHYHAQAVCHIQQR